MAVTSIGSSLNSYIAYYTSNVQSEDKVKKENTKKTYDKNIEDSMFQTDKAMSDNKTNSSKGKIQTPEEYSKYLYKKFDFVNKTCSMYGIKTTVTVSNAFIKKCANDPEKAKFLEENLAVIPDNILRSSNFVKMGPGNPVMTYETIVIDDNGNFSGTCGITNDPDGKIARENATKRLKENKEKTNKAEERQAAKRVEKKKAKRKWMTKIAEENVISNMNESKIAEKNFAYMEQVINIGSNFNSYS